eukprot:1807090-Prymnesium_polylepis.1
MGRRPAARPTLLLRICAAAPRPGATPECGGHAHLHRVPFAGRASPLPDHERVAVLGCRCAHRVQLLARARHLCGARVRQSRAQLEDPEPSLAVPGLPAWSDAVAASRAVVRIPPTHVRAKRRGGSEYPSLLYRAAQSHG